MHFEETAGTQEAFDDSAAVDTTNADTTLAAEEALTEEAGGLFPSTPPPEKAIPQPQAHRGVITGVTAETTPNTGTRFLKFSYQSKETAASDNLAVWLPAAYVANPQIDASALSDEPGPISETTGKPGQSERQKYASAVRNSKGNGTIESIVKLATEQGHSVSLPIPRTFEQLANYLNSLCVGTEVVALQRADGGEGDFADLLRCRGFVAFEYASNPKFLKNYRKIWENE